MFTIVATGMVQLLEGLGCRSALFREAENRYARFVRNGVTGIPEYAVKHVGCTEIK